MVEKNFEKAKKEFSNLLILELICILFELITEAYFDPSSLIAVIILAAIFIVLFVFLGILPAKKGKIMAGIFGLLVAGFFFYSGGWINILLGIVYIILSINYLYRRGKN